MHSLTNSNPHTNTNPSARTNKPHDRSGLGFPIAEAGLDGSETNSPPPLCNAEVWGVPW